MNDRRKDLVALAALLAVLILVFAKILFTDKVIRAPDITAEFLWTVKHFSTMNFIELFPVNLQAGWDFLTNGGTTEGGGTLSLRLLYYRNLIFWLFPLPASIAWFILLHLFFGAVGTYCCCRAIGTGRSAALLGGLIFAVAPEIATLINAGHVQKIATISFAPWAFFLLERGFQTRRTVFFLSTGVILALQFFNMHWQIAFYTCLGLGGYGVFRAIVALRDEGRISARSVTRLVGLNLVTLVFFLSTVAISLVPVADWSKDTTRGSKSGANQGQGGLNVEEAMSWSLPPEELASFIIPGMFGLSRQEGGYNGNAIDSYYWGRMVFTQTSDYFGLLPWLLLPLPLMFRRDRFTWLALAAVVGGILFSLGKYTPFYWFLYEHFPGVNHFRVPKMMMFVPLLGVAVLAARGVDLLMSDDIRQSPAFRRYLWGIAALPLILLLVLGMEVAAKSTWFRLLGELISQPNRFEQGAQLVAQRWRNLVQETGIAAGVAALHAAGIIFFCRRSSAVRFLPVLLMILFLADTGRVNGKFMLLQPMPQQVRGVKTPVISWLEAQSKEYRILPLDGSDPMQYVSHTIPVFFTSNPVQMQRWQNYLDSFLFSSAMPDIMNVRYVICGPGQAEQLKGELGERFVPVYQSPDGSATVLENRRVLPKVWLVPAAMVVDDPAKALSGLANPVFDPRRVALVESPPPLSLAGNQSSAPPGDARVTRYESNMITVSASNQSNALLVMGEKYAKGWHATVDGRRADIYPVDYILRGVYLPPGNHTVEYVFDPLPFKIGKLLTFASLAFFVIFLVVDGYRHRRRPAEAAPSAEG